MAAYVVTNGAYSTLASSLGSAATTMTIQAGHGARFPSISAGDFTFITLQDSSNNIEIVKATARSVDTFTIVRAQEGTTARAYASADIVELRYTAAVVATVDGTQTLTNKTLTAPSISSPTFTTAVPVSGGGTGLTTLTANNLLLGNGTGNVQFVAPSTNGNVLTSNGTTWVSSPSSTFVSSVTATSPLASSGGNTPDISLGTVPVTKGGTGVTSATAYALLAGGTTSTGSVQSLASVGTAGQLLTSNGAGALPTFQAAPSGGVTSLTAGNSMSVSASTGAVTVSYSGSFNSVGSYTLATINNAGASSGSNYSAGTGTGQLRSVAVSNDLTVVDITNNLSGTWKWMGGSSSVNDVWSVCCRVS